MYFFNRTLFSFHLRITASRKRKIGEEDEEEEEALENLEDEVVNRIFNDQQGLVYIIILTLKDKS